MIRTRCHVRNVKREVTVEFELYNEWFARIAATRERSEVEIIADDFREYCLLHPDDPDLGAVSTAIHRALRFDSVAEE